MRIKLNVYMVLLLVLAAVIVVPTAGRAEDGDGLSLADWFGFKDELGFIQKLDVPAVSDQGIEIKLNEVLIEGSQVYFSALVTAEKEITEDSLRLNYISDGLKIGNRTFDLEQEHWYESPGVASGGDQPKRTIMIVLRASVLERALSEDAIPMTVTIGSFQSSIDSRIPGFIEGHWEFDLVVDGAAPKKLTRRIPIDHAFSGDGRTFTAVEMIVTPVRTRILTQRRLPKDQFVIKMDAGQQWSPDPQGNLLGFIVSDGQGNQIEVARRAPIFPDGISELQDCAFYSDSVNNGWDWIRDVETITLTPYITTVAGPEKDINGLQGFYKLESFNVTAGGSGKLEAFLQDFEPDYRVPDYVYEGGLDTENPYVKPVRLSQRTKSGAVIMLDKVLVTEDEIAVSVLLGIERPNENWTPPYSFQLGIAGIEVGPKTPYPPDYFEIHLGGGGGGGPELSVVSEDPFVVYDTVWSRLMFSDGYVSPKAPMQVKVQITGFEMCWDEQVREDYYETYCYKENGPWVFEFDTDGTELAEKTKEFELDETVDVDGRTISIHRLRFNPLHFILFTGPFEEPGEDYYRSLNAFAETDEGTILRMSQEHYPYLGFSRKTVDPEKIASLEATEKLKIHFCLNDLTAEFPMEHDWEDISYYTCDPAWSTVIDLN